MHFRYLAIGLSAALYAVSTPLAAQAGSGGDAAMALLPHLAERAGPDGNLIYSPVSVNQAAAVADIESAGTSLQGRFRPALPASVLDSSDREVTVRVANALWLARAVRLAEGAEERARALGTTTMRADFARRDALSGRINGWVSSQTAGQIASVIAPREIDPADRAMVTGALFFDGEWATPLKGRSTASFNTASGPARDLAVRTGIATAAVARSGAWRALRMAYTNPCYAMDVIVPDSGAALPDAATIDGLGTALDASANELVAVQLPEFAVSYETGLIEALGAIGVQWPGLRAREQVRAAVRPDRNRFGIDAVKLAAKLELTDNGGAIAKADLGVAATSFAADRPFLLLIRDREQGAILFVARIANPTAATR